MSEPNRTDAIKHKIKVFTLAGLLLASSAQKANASEPNGKTQTQKANQNSDKLTTPIKITKQSDIEKLFEYALPIIFAELILEEVPMSYAYHDGGKIPGLNTVGIGSTTSPANLSDYDNPDAKWFHIAANPNTFHKRKYSYEDMLKLVIGWGTTRKKTQDPFNKKFENNPVVLNRMFTQLNGLSITPYEFSALYCAVYNLESNITKLLPEIKTNFNNKIKCANLLREWWSKPKTPHNSGTKFRCLFEALVFLNENDFCNSMLNMQTKPSARASCIYAENIESYCASKLTKRNCAGTSNTCKSIYLRQIYKCSVTPTNAMHNLGKYFKVQLTPTIDVQTENLRTDYNKAIKLYNQEKYQQALDIFLDLQNRGANGPDLLNDIAISYLNLKQYDDCIKTCKKVLQSGVQKEYAKTCYNAGKAYEAQGNYAKALKNYENALKYFNEYGIADKDPNVPYKQIYTTAIERVKSLVNSEPQTQSAKKKTTPAKSTTTPKKKQGSKNKSAAFLVGSLAVANKRHIKPVPKTRSNLNAR